MTTLTPVLRLVRSRKLVHVVGVEFLRDGQAEVQLVHDTTLCGVAVRSELEDLDVHLADCPRCAARADSLAAQ